MSGFGTEKTKVKGEFSLLKIGIAIFVFLILLATSLYFIIGVSASREVEEFLHEFASEHGLQIEYTAINVSPFFKTLTIEEIEITGERDGWASREKVFGEQDLWEIGKIKIDGFWDLFPILTGNFEEVDTGFHSGTITIKDQRFQNNQMAELKTDYLEFEAHFFYSQEYNDFLKLFLNEEFAFEDLNYEERKEFANKANSFLTSVLREDSSNSLKIEGFETRGNPSAFFQLGKMYISSSVTAEGNLHSSCEWQVSLERLEFGENHGERASLESMDYSLEYIVTGELTDFFQKVWTDFSDPKNLEREALDEMVDAIFGILLGEKARGELSLKNLFFSDDGEFSLQIGALDYESSLKPEEKGTLTKNVFILNEFFLGGREEQFNVDKVSYSLDYLIGKEFLDGLKETLLGDEIDSGERLLFSEEEGEPFSEEIPPLFKEKFWTQLKVRGVEFTGSSDVELGIAKLLAEAEVLPEEDLVFLLNVTEGHFGQAFEIGVYSFKDLHFAFSVGPDFYLVEEDQIPPGRLKLSLREFYPYFAGPLEQEINTALFLLGFPISVNDLYLANLTQEIEYRDNRLRNNTEIGSSLMDIGFYFRGETISDSFSELEQAWIEEIELRLGDLPQDFEPILLELTAVPGLYLEEKEGEWILRGANLRIDEMF